MIDLKKPLEMINNCGDDFSCSLVGVKKDGDLVVEADRGGALFTFKPCGEMKHKGGSVTLRNVKEPWEQAYNTCIETRDFYFTEKEYFKKVFNLGFNWCQNKS